MPTLTRFLGSLAFGLTLVACSSAGSGPSSTGASTAATGSGGSGGSGGNGSGGAGGVGGQWTPPVVTSFARTSDTGEILGVGVVVPVKSFENIPALDPAFRTDLGVEMPANVRDKTFIQLLRINWLAGGHGPAPYAAPHFDLHFYRGTKDEVDGINCMDSTPFPSDVLAAGYETPSTCVPGMGFHAWPSADIQSNTFSASIILGYAAQKMVFVEPMVTRERFLARKSFELDVARPQSLGGPQTLFPAHLTATYAADTDAYSFEFNQFATID